MDNYLASSEVDSTVLPPQPFAGDEPSVSTIPGSLLAGQNLAAGTVLMRDAATGSFTKWVVGTAPAIAVLCHDIDATAGVTACEVYIGGCFNTQWLTWPAGITIPQKTAAFDGSKLVHRSLYYSFN